ncbi:MAG TPA: carboxypeptidase regulatory-like domain-containing protein [Pyrinomonadaceae bacterium]|jgi:hypothetical protein
MRYRLALAASVFFLLLALAVPSILNVDAAHSNPAATPDTAPSASPRQRPSGGARTRSEAAANLSEPEAIAAERIRQSYALLPLSFEANRGQADARVQFLARNSAYSLYLTSDEITLALRGSPAGAQRHAGRTPSGGSALRIKLLGANRQPRSYGLDELQGKSNYLMGSDPAQWRTNVPNYGRVKYEGVYPGVDVIYYGTNRELEYDFVVAPGADARLIRLRVEGAKGLRVDANGDLVLPTPAGEVRQHAPHAYQEVAGVRQTVACRYVLKGAGRVGFEVGAYDRGLPLVIDPVISYSTFLGGSGYDEGNAVAVDAQGNAYVTGYTRSSNFPVTPNAPQPGIRATVGDYDAFITKLNADGSALVYSTYLGGNYGDSGTSIAVDGAGQAHVAGETESTNFPVTPGSYRTTRAGSYDVFVSKLSADGSALLYSTYLGGSGGEYDPRLALGSDGLVYVAGRTYSSNYPVTQDAFQVQPRGISQNLSEGFVTKLAASPAAGVLFSTYLGGAGYDFVEGIAVASGLDDSVYVTGRTSSTNFPTTPNAWQGTLASDGSNNDSDAFVTRLNSAGTQALFSTYFGGAGYDAASAIAVDGAGAVYITGFTMSPSLHVTPGAFQTNYAGVQTSLTHYTGVEAGWHNQDAFVAKLRGDGASVLYSTYFGGSGADTAKAIAVDAQGNAYVVGDSTSTDLPAAGDGWQATYGGGSLDGFFFKLDAAGASVPYATYLGGSDWEQLRGLALDASGDVYLIGTTYSYDFYVKPGAVQTDRRGYGDSFVTKIALGVQDYQIGGRVTNQYGNGLVDVEVSVSGTVSRVVRTDADGYYKVNGLPQGAEVTLTARRLGFIFDPQGVTLSNLSQDETVNFSGPAPLLIRGRVLNEFGSGVGWLPVAISGSLDQTLYTDDNGYYAFNVPAGGTYTVTPGPHYEFTFAPQSQVFNELTDDQTFDFAALFPPSIHGRIYDGQYGYNIGYMQVTLTSPSLPQPLVQQTDPSGFFSFENLERGVSYTVTPADPMTNRSFSPPQRTVAAIQGREFFEFAALPFLAIHGRVADPNGNGVTGVATLTGTVNAETQVDEWGYFSFMHLPRGGDYTVTITKPGSPSPVVGGGASLYTFSPPSRSVTNLQEMQFFEFTALPPLRIIGQVADANYTGLRATVTLSGTVNATVQADEYGFYSFDELPRGGDYTVTPSYPLYTFTPPSRSVSNIQEMQFLHFEALPPLRIRGGVFDENWQPISGATVTLAGAVNATATTDETGFYEFTDLPRGGNYIVTPAHELYTFTPPPREFQAMSTDQFASFQGALRRFTLSGRAADAAGAPLSGVILTLGGGANSITQTDANGNYAFSNLAVGRDYNVAAARPGYAFAPESIAVTNPRGDQTANFNGSRLTYTVSGRITDAAGGASVAGASVSLNGSLSATTQSDAQGNYTFTGLPSEGNYTITPSHPNFNFAPASRPFTNLLSDVEADFAAARINYQIGGRVTGDSGALLGGVTVTLGGARSATAQTDATGQYLFADLPSGFDYTLTVALTHYTFSPPAREVGDLNGDTTADFTATLLTHTISGRVVDSNGNGFPGALVQLIGTRTGSITTDATGNYSFASLPAGGNYTVEPSREFYDFNPTRGIFNDLSADGTATFTAVLRTFQIGGRITEGANGVAGVTVNLSGSRTATTQTDAAGNYLFTQLPANGNYTATPAHPFYAFSPGGASFNTLPFNQTANFAAARLLYQVSGYTLDVCGRPIPGVTMSLTRDGLTANAQTDAAGFYSFNGVPAGYNYTLAPTGSAYTFNPPSVSFPALNANQAINFTGTPPISNTDAPALADTYVRGGSATSNFGTATQLIARLANQTKDTYETYLKFDAGAPCTVSAVKLRLYGKLSSSGTLPVAIYGVPATVWTETGMNWNDKPAAGALLRTFNVSGTTAAWYEWDVTDYVRAELSAGRSTVSFVLKSNATTNYQVIFNSREAAGINAPRLVVTAQ